MDEKKWTEEVESQKVANGPMYLWDVARINGMDYRPGDQGQHQLLMDLVKDCDEIEADSAHLKEKGYKKYDYMKVFETQRKGSSGKSVAIIAQGKLEGEEEWRKAESMLTGSSSSSSKRRGDSLGEQRGRVKPKKLAVCDATSQQRWDQFCKSHGLHKLKSEATVASVQFAKCTDEPYFTNEFKAKLEALPKAIDELIAQIDAAKATSRSDTDYSSDEFVQLMATVADFLEVTKTTLSKAKKMMEI